MKISGNMPAIRGVVYHPGPPERREQILLIIYILSPRSLIFINKHLRLQDASPSYEEGTGLVGT